MGIYYFHIRDDFGVVEDADGIELPDLAALLTEVIRSANELSREATTHHSMRFEIADATGLSETQVKGHLQYGLTLLRKAYKRG